MGRRDFPHTIIGVGFKRKAGECKIKENVNQKALNISILRIAESRIRGFYYYLNLVCA